MCSLQRIFNLTIWLKDTYNCDHIILVVRWITFTFMIISNNWLTTEFILSESPSALILRWSSGRLHSLKYSFLSQIIEFPFLNNKFMFYHRLINFTFILHKTDTITFKCAINTCLNALKLIAASSRKFNSFHFLLPNLVSFSTTHHP